MNSKEAFDNMLKSYLDINKQNIDFSNDTFEKAWNKKDERFTMFYPKKAVLTYVCCTFVFFATIAFISSDARNITYAAYNSIRTIFTLEKHEGNYKVVSKSENEKLHHETIGGIQVTDLNRNQVEKSLGFKLFFPEKVGEEYKKSKAPSVGITVYNIKLKDYESGREKFLKAAEDDESYKKLSNNYEMKKFALAEYSDGKNNNFIVHLANGKEKDMSNSKIVQEMVIENVKCKVVEKTSAVYQGKYEDGFYCDDYTQKPENTTKLYYIFWNYNGTSYGVTSSGSFNFDAANKFTENYIKALIQQ